MRVVRGKAIEEITDIDPMISDHERVVIDVGTGDGRFPFDLAGRQPQTLVFALDTAPDNFRELSHRASRRRDRRPNLHYVWADITAPPAALRGCADALHVNLPWGVLMIGLIRSDPAVLDGLRALAKPGSPIHVVLNNEVWGDPIPLEARDLPEPTIEYVQETLVSRWATHGWQIEDSRWLTRPEIDAMSSTWARKLSHSRDEPKFLALKAHAV